MAHPPSSRDVSQTPTPLPSDPVQAGVCLALQAHRMGLMDDRALDAVLAYYDNEGARDPFPYEEVLVRLGGVPPAAIRDLVYGERRASPSDIQGEKFNERLVLLEPIGQGGMGSVYRAYDRVLKRVVAIKRLKTDHLDGPAQQRILSRFEREAHAMARVRHPACVQIFDAGLKDGEPYLVMEFVQGKSLRGFLELSPRCPPELVAGWGVAVADALQACHDVGLVHRDVKPANILLDAENKPHLTDFGVALDDRAQTKLTVDKSMVGTLTYMPAEQALGERVDARSDVYSLGATLFEALTGRPPFDSPSTLVLLRMVLEGDAPTVRSLRPDCPEDLDTVVMKCLSRPPADRYATAMALGLDLRRFLSGEPVLATPVTGLQRVGRSLWRHRRLVGATLAGLAVLAGGLAVNRFRVKERQRAAIESALSEAAVASDLAAVELKILPLVAVADREVADQARETLRMVRARRHLRDAEAAVERWRALVKREQECADEIDALREKIDPQKPYAECPEKRRVFELEDEQKRAKDEALTVLFEAERLMAQASTEAPELTEVSALAARVLLRRGRLLEDHDPVAAEALFLQAIEHDAKAGGALKAELAGPILQIVSDPPATCRVMTLREDSAKGHASEFEVSRAETPTRVQLAGAGEFVIEIVPSGDWLAVRDAICLTRGLMRSLRYRLVNRGSLGPLADDFVDIPGGLTRWGDGFGRATDLGTFLIQRHETTLDHWRSFALAQGNPPALRLQCEQIAPDPTSAARMPAFGMTYEDAQEFVHWMQEEISLAGLPYQVSLPSTAQFFRSLRGELAWLYPWGRRFDGFLCHSTDGLDRNGFTVDMMLEARSGDQSLLGARDLASRFSEYASDSTGLATVVGGSGGMNQEGIERSLVSPLRIHPKAGAGQSAFRLVLTPAPKSRDAANPNLSRSLVVQAREIWNSDLSDRAYKLTCRAIEADRTNALAWALRCEMRMARGDHWGAHWDSTFAIQSDPRRSDYFVRRGIIQLVRGLYESAHADATRATTINPKYAEALALRGESGARLGRLDEARRDFDAALALDPHHRPAIEGLKRLKRVR